MSESMVIKVELEVTPGLFSFNGCIWYYLMPISGCFFNYLGIFYHCGFVSAHIKN